MHHWVALPQLPLKHGNTVLLPDLLLREMYMPSAAVRASEFRLGLVMGGANVLLAPFWALPMSYGGPPNRSALCAGEQRQPGTG